jgi:hypothetical protein
MVWLISLIALPPGVLVDRAIAVIDNEVITHSELLREARIALVMREGARAASEDLPTELLASFLDEYLLNQVIIASQARRLGAVDVSQEDVDRQVDRFAALHGSPAAYKAFLRRFDISQAALRDTLRRDIRVERYVAERMRAWKFGYEGAPKERDQQYREALKRWMRELREGVELRILSPSGQLELQSREHGSSR